MAKNDNDNGEDKSQVQPAAQPESAKAEAQPAPQAPDRVAELEKKLGEISKTVSDQNEFIQGASVVINTIAYDPELRTAFQQKLRGGVVGQGENAGFQPQQSNPQGNAPAVPQNQTPKSDDKLNDVEQSQREEVLRTFEKEAGIEGMAEEDKKETRRKIEGFLNEFGWSVGSLPLSRLRANLDKAYQGTQIDKLREEGRLQGAIQMAGNAGAVMPTLSGNNPNHTSQEQDLTAEQKKWLEKTGVDVEKAKKTYFAREEEYRRPSKAELPKEE